MPCIWNDWLPAGLAERMKREEPGRFCVLINQVCNVWMSRDASVPVGMSAGETLPYVPLVITMLDAKVEPGVVHMQKLANVLLDIVLSTESDLTCQTRWAGVLHRVLKTHGKKIEIDIPWKPLYEMVRRQHLCPTGNYEGAGVMEARRNAMVHLIHQSRRFFELGTAGEMWEHFKPCLRNPHSTDALESVGWLCMMMPTQEALKGEGDWGEWINDWLDTWGCVLHNQTWDSLWFSLIARLAKHDVYGMVDWHAVFRQIGNRFLWAFNVPVGSASASSPFSVSTHSVFSTMFRSELQSRSASVAKALIYSIGRENLMGDAAMSSDLESDDPALECLETFVDVFEQYYHPSNGGKWSSGLAMFLRELGFHLCKRLVAEHFMITRSHNMESGGESEEEMSEGDEDEEESFIGSVEDGVDSSVTDEDIAGGGIGWESDANSKPTPVYGKNPRKPLKPELQKKIVELIMRLALKGQSGKDSNMRRYSSMVLSMLANIEPQMILPEVHKHFVVALNTVTAAKQYGNAIQTLSLCVRPMLLAGIQAPEDMGHMDIGVREHGIQCIADAMNATLPGIDANDPPKSLAVFRLYCCVLSCVGPLEDDEDVLCVFTEAWADELLSRIFTILANVDSPEGGGEHSSHAGAADEEDLSFLLNENSMFRPLVELLFARLPEKMRQRAIKRTSKFLLGTTLSSAAPEASILCNAMAWADPSSTSYYLLGPLISVLEGECESMINSGLQIDVSSGSSSQLSKVQETTLSWKLCLLTSMFYHIGPEILVYGDKIKEILRTLLRSPSLTVQTNAGRALSSLLIGLVSYYPMRQYEGIASHTPKGEFSMEPFVDKFGEFDLMHVWKNGDLKDSKIPTAPVWHDPSDAEMTLANQMLVEFVENPAREIIAAGEKGSPLNRLHLRSLLMGMEGSLEGARSCLPDFDIGLDLREDDLVTVIGSLGKEVGSRDLRHLVGQSLLHASKLIHSGDVETLTVLLRLLDSTISFGCSEYHSSASSASAWFSDDKWLQQPSVSGSLQDSGDLTWRRRRPRWVAIEKVAMNLEWRASQSSYRWFASSKMPYPEANQLPKVYLDLIGEGMHYMLHGSSNLQDLAGSIVERSAKRFPSISKYVCAPICAAIGKLDSHLKFDPSVTCIDILPDLLDAAKRSPIRAAKGSASIPESDQVQRLGVAGISTLRRISSWRYFTRNYEAYRCLILSLISSFAYSSPQVQVAMSIGQLMLALRSMRPPSVQANLIAQQICNDCIQIVEESKKQDGASLSGRHAIAMNAIPLFILPDIPPSAAAQLMHHYTDELLSDTPTCREIASVGISAMLLPVYRPYITGQYSENTQRMSEESVASALDALRNRLEKDGKEFLPKLIKMMAYDHHALNETSEGGQNSQMASMSSDEGAVIAATSTLFRNLEWPSPTSTGKAIRAGEFITRYARMCQLLVEASPSLVLGILRESLQEVLSKPQDGDRAMVAACAEVMAGILASGKIFQDIEESESPWVQWVGDCLAKALDNAPLDFLSLWGECALRFGINGLREKHISDSTIKLIVDSFVPDGQAQKGVTSSSDLSKRVFYLSEIFDEMGKGMPLGHPPGPVVPSSYMKDFMMLCVRNLPGLASKGSESDMGRQDVAVLVATVTLAALLMERDQLHSSDPKSLMPKTLLKEVNQMLDGFFEQFDSAADCLFVKNKDRFATTEKPKSAMEIDDSVANGTDNQAHNLEDCEVQDREVLARVAFGCEIVYQLLASSSSLASPYIIRMLKNIMKVSELIPSSAQFVGSVVRLTLRACKYQTLEPRYVQAFFESLLESCNGQLWTERAAALSTLQYFWFRNILLLGESGSEKVIRVAMQLLEDSKHEVRELASATVSGVIKALPVDRQAAIRREILDRAMEVFPERKRRRVAKQSNSGDVQEYTLAERHGGALSLRALVMSSPYDVPTWLPEVLMTLVRISSEPAPVKTTVTAALADFRRTHEEGGLQEMKDVMTLEQWEAIRDVATPASYFV